MRQIAMMLAFGSVLGCGSSSSGGGGGAGTDTATGAEVTAPDTAQPEDAATEDTPAPPQDTATEDTPAPGACGPIPGGACPGGMTCDVHGCGVGATGTCVAKAGLCPEGAPVCGCDGKTYDNDCVRVLAGAAKDHDGACDATACLTDGGCGKGEVCDVQGCLEGAGHCAAKPEVCTGQIAPVCGCNGQSYVNDCLRLEAGVAKDHDGNCEGKDKVCGPIPGGGCPDGEVCDLLSCGDGALGSCQPQPGSCPDGAKYVCGCDGQTYEGECERLSKGVAKDHDGPCEVAPKICGPIPDGACPEGGTCDVTGCGIGGTGACTVVPTDCGDEYAPVCGCDGTTYTTDCARLQANVHKDHDGACTSPGTFCGGIGALPCPEGKFCNYDAGCGFDDGGGTCLTIPEMCLDNYDPVCGCDGKTYSNACTANGAGVSVQSVGACK